MSKEKIEFKISTTGYFYDTERKELLENKLGFKFDKNEDPLGLPGDNSDEWMKDTDEIVMHMTWDEFRSFVNEWGNVIVSYSDKYGWHAEIYDDYRE